MFHENLATATAAVTCQHLIGHDAGGQSEVPQLVSTVLTLRLPWCSLVRAPLMPRYAVPAKRKGFKASGGLKLEHVLALYLPTCSDPSLAPRHLGGPPLAHEGRPWPGTSRALGRLKRIQKTLSSEHVRHGAARGRLSKAFAVLLAMTRHHLQ